MILDLHSEALVGGIERRAFGDGPRFQHAIHFQAKVIVQAGGVVLLHYEAVAGFALDFRGRLGSLLEFSFPFVFFEGHWRTLFNHRVTETERKSKPSGVKTLTTGDTGEHRVNL